jgi:hypothetical protein
MKITRYCLVFSLAIVLALNSCTFVSTKVGQTERTTEDFHISSPAKAHLLDGSMVVFADGFEMTGDSIKGNGIWYNLARDKSARVPGIPLDSLAFLEHYFKQLQPGPFLGSLCAPAVFCAALSNEDIRKAFFGSCPTVYSFDGEDYFLEAENFSYSIAKRFEANDLDRLESGEIVDGLYRLKIANEAYETHYINQFSLLAVDHPTGYEVFPTENHDLLLLGEGCEVVQAVSKSGEDVTHLISSRDDRWYRSDSLVLHELTQSVVQDWIDLEVTVPPEATKMYVALRLRNTLLNTVLLYDVMLRSQGAEAIDWVGSKSGNLLYAWRLDRWYKRHFGLHIQVSDGGKFTEVARIPDTGPIAWHQVASELPVPHSETALLRFAFLPDNWTIDWIGVSFDGRKDIQVSSSQCLRITDSKGEEKDNLIHLIKEKDKRYLVTYPGESYIVTFNPDPIPEGQERTYLVKSRGFYIEWIRQDWIASPYTTGGEFEFQLNESSVIKAAQLWLSKKPYFEKQFFESKISHQGGQNR